MRPDQKSANKIASLLLFFCLMWNMPAYPKDTLVIGVTQFPNNFNPLINSMMAKSYILAFARKRMTLYDENWNLVCVLCDMLPSIQNGMAVFGKKSYGNDGVSVTFRLDKRAVWGDGTPITTKDVLFTWKVGKHKLTGVSDYEIFRRISNIEILDSHSFIMHLDQQTCDFANLDNFQLLPAHIEAKNFSIPAEYRNRSAYETETTNPGLWFGPYVVNKVVPGSHVIFEQNKFWWGRKPHFKRITVLAIENTASITANLLAGGIDMIAGEIGLTIDQALAFQQRYGERFEFLYKPSLIYEHIDFNFDNPILKDRRVRQALLYSVDRNAISSQLFKGHQPVAHSNINPLDASYNQDVKKYAFNPQKARKLLDEAGWSTNKDGLRYNHKGEALRFELMTTSGDKTRELIQQVLQSQWRHVGVGVRIKNQPPRVYFGNTINQRRFKSLAMYAWLSAPNSLPRSQLHSAMIPSKTNGWSGQNFPGFTDPRMDKMLDEAEKKCEQPAQRKLRKRLQQLYAEELPALPLYFRATSHIIPKWLNGIEPTGHQYSTANWVEHWGVKE